MKSSEAGEAFRLHCSIVAVSFVGGLPADLTREGSLQSYLAELLSYCIRPPTHPRLSAGLLFMASSCAEATLKRRVSRPLEPGVTVGRLKSARRPSAWGMADAGWLIKALIRGMSL